MNTLSQKERKELIILVVEYLYSKVADNIDLAIDLVIENTIIIEQDGERDILEVKDIRQYILSKKEQIDITVKNMTELLETFATLISY